MAPTLLYSQSTNGYQCVTKRSFHKSDTELATSAAAAQGFKRGHKRNASEVYTDAAADIKSGTREPIQ